MKPESEVQQEIQIKAMHFKCTLMRNNSGSLIDKDGRPVRFGLGNISKQHNDKIKSSDLIGITEVVITQEMVGKTLGVFTAFECKEEAWKSNKKLDARETAQLAFINFVKAKGGIASFVNSVDELPKIFGE
jgi:hypothetical protein